MLINKINSNLQRQTFKGYQHKVNEVGDRVLKFNYPFDYTTQDAYIEIYKVRKNDSAYAGYEIIKEKQINPNTLQEEMVAKPIKRVRLNKEKIETEPGKFDFNPDGVEVDLADIPQLEKNETFAYRIFVNGNVMPETGLRIDDNFILVSQAGTAPTIGGAACLMFPDSQRVGIKYHDFDSDKTGEIFIDKDEQKKMEQVDRTFSNKMGGNLAGIEYEVRNSANNTFKRIFLNPIVGGDNKSSHHYWNKNNFQISDDMGNIENYASLIRTLFQRGKTYVNDGTFTSEGLEGINYQYAMRWAGKDPSSYYYFKMQGIDNEAIGLGVIPENDENLRHVIINPPVLYNEESGKIENNPKYDSNKETYIQIYDASLVKEESLVDLEKPFEKYDNIEIENPLLINTHNDTVVNYAFEINPEEYVDRLNAFTRFNKGLEEKIKLNSPEGTRFIGQFFNFKLTDKTPGGTVTWDANTDINKMNYQISGYDEKNELAEVDSSTRDYRTMMRKRGSFAVQDMTIQAVRYWTKTVNDIQLIYTAKTLQNAKTKKEIAQKIESGLLPAETYLNSNEISNILNGFYNLKQKGSLDKDNTTIKALMSLPLTTLEFAENTVGVLSSPYFSNRAINEETSGMTRFELLQNNEPHLVEPFTKNYMKTNLLFTNDIKNFADEIIKQVNETSKEKLLDEHGNYTAYGEYVIELVAPVITKYAFIKALTGESLKTKILPNGEITYDYIDLKNKTSLKALRINALNPTDEAKQLLQLFEKGIAKLQKSDVEYLASSISERIKGTDLDSFMLAEAMVAKSGLGLHWRWDAIKDLMDQDAIRTRDNDHTEVWDRLSTYLKKLNNAIKAESPSSYSVAELTDLGELMQANFGEESNSYDDKSVIKSKNKNVQNLTNRLFNETGITSEAAYSYFFTDLIKLFGKDFTDGSTFGDNRTKKFMENLNNLLSTKNIDYTRNLMTFIGNHDKPRIVHGFALDMGLFRGNLGIEDTGYENIKDFTKNKFLNGADAAYDENRLNRIECLLQLTNSDKYQDLPLEAKLNLDNMEYFKTVSTKAVAMSQLLRNSINDVLAGKTDETLVKYLKLALVDLTNGNHLGIGNNTEIQSIKIPQLQTIENALAEMLLLAELNLSQEEIQNIINIAKNDDLISKYRIQGDFDWENIRSIRKELRYNENSKKEEVVTIVYKENLAAENRKAVDNIMQDAGESTENIDYKKYSLYAVAIASILGEAFEQIKGHDNSAKENFLKAKKEFIEKYNREFVENNRSQLPFIESATASRAKNGYGAKDIKKAIEMLMNQAEYRAHKDGLLAENEHFNNRENIILNLWKYSTEPAEQKAIMAMAVLSALIGIPTLYSGDELGMSGNEEKAKNVDLQNRNPLPHSETEEGIFKDYRNNIRKRMLEAMAIRSRDGVEALNNGTPYAMSTTNDKIPAFMTQDSEGNITISVFNYLDVSTDPRHNYHQDLGIYDENSKKQKVKEHNIDSINIDNPYVPVLQRQEIGYISLPNGISLPDGLEFRNSDPADTAKYVVGKVPGSGLIAIFKESAKIILDGITAKNGVMVLKHNPKNIVRKLAKI